MKHPDYKWVDLAIDGASNRNRLVDKSKLGDPKEKTLTDAYMTYFRYNQAMPEYFEGNLVQSKSGNWHKSVMGFTGPAYSDFIPIDIDTKDLNAAIYQTIRAVEILKGHDIDVNALKIYFSGSKGFHVLIPAEMVGVEPSEDIHMKFRRFVKRLMVGVQYDSSIYDKVRIFRIVNTINSKSGRYKIPLYPFELYNASADDILTMAEIKREDWEPEEPDWNDGLSELYWREEESKPRETGTTDGVKVKLCLHKMMQGVGEGERDNVGVRVATHLKHAGLSTGMIWAALNEWNGLNRPPLMENELDRIYRQGLQNYDFGCKDALLSAYCDKKCLFYRGG